MRPLSPIDVEYFENKFRKLSENLEKASGFLIPDAYEYEKEKLRQAKALIDSQLTGFTEVLNNCSEGVLFNESIIQPQSVETNINNTVVWILWECQDIISQIFGLNSDLNDYIAGLSLSDPMVWKLDKFVALESKFNSISDVLDDCSVLIMSVLTKLDGYNI